MHMGEKIRAARFSKRWSQVELSRRSHVSRWILSMVERGYRLPTSTELRRLGRVLKIKLDGAKGHNLHGR